MWRKNFSLLLIPLALACATSPTGRKQLLFLSDQELNGLGEASFAEVKKEMKESHDPEVNAEVRCVTARILRALPEQQRGQKWEVVVFEEETPNAFALPGYKIGVHSGMLKYAKTPDQLAAVIGHEVAHVLAKHGNERLSTNVAAQSGLALAAIVTGAATEDPTKRQLIMAALGAGATIGVLLPYGRTQESEADELGLTMMAKAGFDPQAAVTLWQNMEKAGGGEPPEFLSTHPAHGTRIERITAKLPQVRRTYQEAVASGNVARCPAA